MVEPNASAAADQRYCTERYGAMHRRALRSVATQFFVNGVLFASVLPRLPEIRDRIAVSTGGIGWMLSVAGASGLAASALAGPAMQRFGSRGLMLGASSLVCGSLALVGVSSTPALVLVGLAGMVTFDVAVDIAMNLQGSILSARRHSPVINRLHGLWSLGAMVGGIAASRLTTMGVSLTAHFLGSAALMMVVLGYVGRGLLSQDEIPLRPLPVGPSGSAPHRHSPPDSNSKAARPVLVALAVAGFFAVTVEGVPIDWAAFRLRDDLGATTGFAALGYVAVTAGMTLSRFAGDWALVRLGRTRFDQLSIGLAALGLGVASLMPGRVVVMGGLLVSGLGTAALMPSMYDRAAHYRGRPGAGLGALTAGMRTASIIVPTLVGSLAATRLGVGAAIAIVALPCVVGYLLAATSVHRSTTPSDP